jgi:hypothetical protein
LESPGSKEDREVGAVDGTVTIEVAHATV